MTIHIDETAAIQDSANSMTKAAAKTITAGLSAPSKMPCQGWSINPNLCIVGGRLAAVVGSICSGCYAKKGNYKRYSKTMELCWQKRLAATENPLWVPAMVRLIQDDENFRWFDAGDLQSVNMLAAIVAICLATPNTRHWLPTRERGIVAAWLQLNPQGFPSNLTVRLSDAMIDVPATGCQLPASGVHSSPELAVGTVCQAYTRNGRCDACRACWDGSIERISYPIH